MKQISLHMSLGCSNKGIDQKLLQNHGEGDQLTTCSLQIAGRITSASVWQWREYLLLGFTRSLCCRTFFSLYNWDFLGVVMSKLWNVYIFIGRINFVRNSSFGIFIIQWLTITLESEIKKCNTEYILFVAYLSLGLVHVIHPYILLESLSQWLLITKYYQWDFQKELASPEHMYDQNQCKNLKLDLHIILAEIFTFVPWYNWSGYDFQIFFAKISKIKKCICVSLIT